MIHVSQQVVKKKLLCDFYSASAPRSEFVLQGWPRVTVECSGRHWFCMRMPTPHILDSVTVKIDPEVPAEPVSVLYYLATVSGITVHQKIEQLRF